MAAINPTSRTQNPTKKQRRKISDDIFVESKYNPESVSAYYYSSPGLKPANGDAKTLIENAKKHLASIGWTFFYIWKSTDKKELRYRSPSGRQYISLKTACKAYLDGLPMNPDDNGPANFDGFVQESDRELLGRDDSTNRVANFDGFVQETQFPKNTEYGHDLTHYVANFYVDGVVEDTQLPMNFDDYVADHDGFGFPVNLDSGHDSANYFANFDGLALELENLGYDSTDYIAGFDGLVQDSELPKNYDQDFSTNNAANFDRLVQEINPNQVDSVQVYPSEALTPTHVLLRRSVPKKLGRKRKTICKVSSNLPRSAWKIGDPNLGRFVAMISIYGKQSRRDPNVAEFLNKFIRWRIFFGTFFFVFVLLSS